MQDMEKSMRENPLYWKAYQKGIRKDRLQIWAVFMNENPDYDYHYFLNMLKFNSNELCMI